MRHIALNNYRDTPLSIMVACGPFTFKNSLTYQCLSDFLQVVKKDQPHAVVLMGPFLDIYNTDIMSGELYYQSEKDAVYITHEQLFQDLIRMIADELNGLRTKIIFVPSHKDIMHFETLP